MRQDRLIVEYRPFCNHRMAAAPEPRA
jgi:hypothetical protein